MDACRFPAAPQQAIRFKVRCRRAPRGQELWSKFEGCGLQAILPSRNERLWNDRFWRKADIGQDKKRSKSRFGRAKQAAPAAWRLSIVFSTAAQGLINIGCDRSHIRIGAAVLIRG
jgi:hypothetical protein